MATITTDEASTVRVRGFAELEAEPDFAVVTFQIERLDDDADEALAFAADAADECRTALTGATGVRRFAISRVRNLEIRHWDADSERYLFGGYRATLSGTATVGAPAVGAVVAALVSAGAQVGWVAWDLDADNPAFRAVRAQAVADAHRAAEDFAVALDARLGVLVTLADPGLLDQGSRHTSTTSEMVASPAAGAAEDLPIDPEPQTVYATVEACFALAGPVRTTPT